MLSMRFWEHERIVEPIDEQSSRVTDRLAFELRRPMRWIPRSDRLAGAIIAGLFAHRHRRMAALFGAVVAS
jgi:hypothetical protein